MKISRLLPLLFVLMLFVRTVLASPHEVSFTTSWQMTSFVLVDASTDKDIRPVRDGERINLAGLPPQWTVRLTNPTSGTNAIVFQLNGRDYSVDTSAPFAISPNTGSDFSPWNPTLGTYTIAALAYSDNSTQLVSHAIQLEFYNNPSEASLSAPSYYIDKNNGNDSNTGLSPETAWASVQNIATTSFPAGSKILFKRGQTFSRNQSLTLHSSGTINAPIIISSYGTGALPKIANTRNILANEGDALNIFGSNVIVREIAITQAYQHGILVRGANVVIHHVDISNAGLAITIDAENTRVQNNVIHDLHMVVNDSAPDNDYGAVGIAIGNGSNFYVADNYLYNLIEESIDYGTDGSAVEIYVTGAITNVEVTRNRIENCDNATEIGSGEGLSLTNYHLHHNVITNCRGIGVTHILGGNSNFGAVVNDFAMDNNTIVDVDYYWQSDTAPENSIFFRNNIIKLINRPTMSFTGTGVVRQQNIYDASNQAVFSFSFMPSETFANPRLISIAGQDFRLRSNSPALNTGLDLGYSRDMAGLAFVNQADMGAYDYRPIDDSQADIDTDSRISPTDVIFVINRLGQSPTGANALADVNEDGLINALDVSLGLFYLGR